MARLRSPSNCFYRNLWTQSSIRLLLGEFRKRTNEILYYRDPKHKEEFSQMNETDKQRYATRDMDNFDWMQDAISQFEKHIAPYLNFHGYKESNGLRSRWDRITHPRRANSK